MAFSNVKDKSATEFYFLSLINDFLLCVWSVRVLYSAHGSINQDMIDAYIHTYLINCGIGNFNLSLNGVRNKNRTSVK
jgi:hypothetical protein